MVDDRIASVVKFNRIDSFCFKHGFKGLIQTQRSDQVVSRS